MLWVYMVASMHCVFVYTLCGKIVLIQLCIATDVVFSYTIKEKHIHNIVQFSCRSVPG